MSLEPHDPARVPQEGQGLGYPTEELPAYRKIAAHPEPTGAPEQRTPPHGSGELPVSGAPVAAAPEILRPRGPHLPTVVSGVVVLALAALVFVWRLVDDPDWPVVGIVIGITAGVLFVVAAGISLVTQRTRSDHEFDRMLSGS